MAQIKVRILKRMNQIVDLVKKTKGLPLANKQAVFAGLYAELEKEAKMLERIERKYFDQIKALGN